MWGQSLTDQIGVEVRGRSDVPILHLQHHVVRYFLLDYVYEECSELLLVLLSGAETSRSVCTLIDTLQLGLPWETLYVNQPNGQNCDWEPKWLVSGVLLHGLRQSVAIIAPTEIQMLWG